MPIFASSNSSEKTEITQKYGNQTEEYAKKWLLSIVESLSSGKALKPLKESYLQKEQQEAGNQEKPKIIE